MDEKVRKNFFFLFILLLNFLALSGKNNIKPFMFVSLFHVMFASNGYTDYYTDTQCIRGFRRFNERKMRVSYTDEQNRREVFPCEEGCMCLDDNIHV